jgi:hypothetical protein
VVEDGDCVCVVLSEEEEEEEGPSMKSVSSFS